MPNVTINEDELRRLLDERDHLRKQVTALQERGTELIQENRALTKYANVSIDVEGGVVVESYGDCKKGPTS